MRESALAYARLGWPIFRLSHSKVPLKGSRGFKDATVDEDVIRGWWPTDTTEFNNWNIGLACGHLIVIDCDGESALTEFKRICAERGGGIPRTACVKTRRGWHFYFTAPAGKVIRTYIADRSQGGDDGIDIKGAKADGSIGSYVVAPPSISVDRNGNIVARYQWLLGLDHLIEMPEWLLDWCAEYSGRGKRRKAIVPFQATPPILPGEPDYPLYGPRLANAVLAGLRSGELPDFLQALELIPAACGYDSWFSIGAAIHDFDPGPDGLAIFKAWSHSAEGYRTEEALASCETKWNEYARPRQANEGRITKATVYFEARLAAGESDASILKTPLLQQGDGACGRTGAPADRRVNGHAHPLPQELFEREPEKVIHWADTDRHGKPQGTTTNAGLAIGGLHIACRKDVFHERMLLGGHAIDKWAGSLSDDAVLILRALIKRQYGFDPGEKNTRDAAVQCCLHNPFNPVLDYLDALAWDGIERIDRWVVDYMGAADSGLVREFGRLMLIAAVRRARTPGTKFDQIVVFEGKEGTGKSSAIKVLAGEDNFSDQNILAATDKEQQEAFTGVWLHEIAELAGMRRTDVERIKQFASRTEDRARPAYGRIRVDMKRRGIFIATTNEETYLKSETGNRRFWPIETGHIDLGGLIRDRDQLWAEAVQCEQRGDSIELGVKWRGLAADVQRERKEEDPWVDLAEMALKLVLKSNLKASTEGVTLLEVLEHPPFAMKPAEIRQIEQTRMARCLIENGWVKFRKRDGNKLKWRYRPA